MAQAKKTEQAKTLKGPTLTTMYKIRTNGDGNQDHWDIETKIERDGDIVLLQGQDVVVLKPGVAELLATAVCDLAAVQRGAARATGGGK